MIESNECNRRQTSSRSNPRVGSGVELPPKFPGLSDVLAAAQERCRVIEFVEVASRAHSRFTGRRLSGPTDASGTTPDMAPDRLPEIFSECPSSASVWFA
jgi:hypothetical protein